MVVVWATFKPVVEGDGVGYYSWQHSLLVDHDLDFANEYQAAFDARVTVNPEHLSTRTGPGGHLADFFPIGPFQNVLPTGAVHRMSVTTIPEPGSLSLLAIGVLAGLGRQLLSRRRAV